MEERAGCSYCGIAVEPSVLYFVNREGSPYNPGVQTLRVKRVGTGELFPRWHTSIDVPWVTLNPDSGDSEATIVVHVKSVGMSVGEYVANITFSSPNAPTVYAGINLSITPRPVPLAITTKLLPSVIVGNSYSYRLEASGGTPPYVWECIGLPTGLTANSKSGIITGIPTTNGSFSVRVAVRDTYVNTDSANFELIVEPAPKPFRIAIMQPIGGETWYVGEKREIKWMVEGDPGNRTLDIYLETPLSEIIGHMIPVSDLTYLWEVPNKVYSGAAVCIVTDYQSVNSAAFSIKEKPQPGCNIFSWSISLIKKITRIRR